MKCQMMQIPFRSDNSLWNVTRYIKFKVKRIKDALCGLVPAPSTLAHLAIHGSYSETQKTYVQLMFTVVEHANDNSVDVQKLLVTQARTGCDENQIQTEGWYSPQIDNYELHGVTKLNDGKDVQTHVYVCRYMKLSASCCSSSCNSSGMNSVMISSRLKKDVTRNQTIRIINTRTVRRKNMGLPTHFYAPPNMKCQTKHSIVEVPNWRLHVTHFSARDEPLPLKKVQRTT